MGDGCGNEAESADEPGSRFGTLEITSRKGGKLQRPVKPEKQGADVSRKTGSHDGPERGWPREPRGSLEGSVRPFRSFWAGGAFKGTSSRGRPIVLKEVIHQLSSRAAPRLTNKTALPVDERRVMTTERAFQLSQGSPLEAACFIACHCGRCSPPQAASKDLPARCARPSSRRSFPGA